MSADTEKRPAGQAVDLLITDARLLDADGAHNIAVRDGRIESLDADAAQHAAIRIDAAGSLVTPAFVDPHFHLDKVLSRGHFGALSYQQAFAHARDVKKHFTVADVEERACRALDLAVANGIGAMRAQIDVDFATGLVSFEGVMRARERFAGLIDIQPIAFPQEGIVTDPAAPDLLREALSNGAELIGGLPEFEENEADQDTHIRTIFDIAEQFDVPLDIHADYTDKARFKTLEKIADVTIERDLQGRVVAGHCCALAVYPDDEAARVIDKLAEAEIQVIVLPIANLQMLGGDARTPYNRGASRILELLDAGINVAAGADNMFDIWYRFNAMDPVFTGLMTCLSGGMRSDEEVRMALDMVTTRASRLMGRYDGAITAGAPADMVVHSAASIADLFRLLPGRRVHIKNGRVVGETNSTAWTSAH